MDPPEKLSGVILDELLHKIFSYSNLLPDKGIAIILMLFKLFRDY